MGRDHVRGAPPWPRHAGSAGTISGLLTPPVSSHDAAVRPGELVLDLGAGHGALTAALLDAGAHVVAVEVDPRAVAVLRRRFDGVRVVEGDLLTVPLPRRPYRVVANLPFATTSATLRRLLDPRGQLVRADLVLQRGAAIGWSQRRVRRFDLRLGPTIPAHRFMPPPSVDAAVLRVTRRR